MGGSVQLDKWYRDQHAVAALLPAEGLFGMLRRTLDLPAAFAALVRRADGQNLAIAAGGKVPGEQVSDVLFVRMTPLELSWVCPQLTAKDRYLCDVRVALTLQALSERTELEALREQIMGSRGAIYVSDVERYLQPHVERAVREAVAAHDTVTLIEGGAAQSVAEAVAENLQAPCFSGGLTIAGHPLVTVSSTTYQHKRDAEQRAARAMDEHAAHGELRDALARAQRAHLDHLEGMLARLNQLAEHSPTTDLAELMRSFEESQRGQLYQALIASRARRRSTRWIAVVAGHEVLFFDAHTPAEIVHRVRLESPAGPLRSLQRDPASGLLLLGGARGVFLLHPEATEAQTVLTVDASRAVRGGFNAAAMRGDVVIATHSELGAIRWRRTEPTAAQPILTEATRGADAVRAAQFAADCFWCTVDSAVVSVPADDLDAAPKVVGTGPATLSALCAAGRAVYAGTSEGDLLAWPDGLESGQPIRLHGGSRRPAESITLIASGGIARLFFTDTSLAVHCRVIGDTFTCRYEAGGQTVRRAECAADLVAATTDARDRVLVWNTDEPERPAAVVSILRLTGHSVQDVCLVPALA